MHRSIKLVLLLMCGLLCFSSCGKRRPPLPPVERVPQRVEVYGQQVGDQVNLVWKMPARNAPGSSSLRINRIDVYRLAERLGEPLSLTEKEFADRSTLIGSVSVDDSDFGLKEMTYQDKLRIVGQAVRLRYAVRLTNISGQKAAFSNFFLIEPISNIAKAPSDVAISVAQNELTVKWSAPEVNSDETSPVNLLGYNVYRSEGSRGFSKLNEKPLAETAFRDSEFSFGTDYRYFLRSVSLGRNAEEVESFSSETVAVSPTDTFPPEPPDALTIAAAPSVISIFFAFNTEEDVAGYRIYRTDDLALSKEDWQLMNSELLKTNSYQDRTALPGVTYHYYLLAVDTAGNISEPSEVVSDTAL